MTRLTNAQLKTLIETQAATTNTNFTKAKQAINTKVDKITGKGLSTNDFTDALQTKLNALPSNADLQSAIDAKTTMSAVEARGYQTALQVQSAIEAANHLEKEIVVALPAVSSASANKIYLILKSNGSNGNAYDEYMVINGAFEKIGDTEVSLTGYARTSDLPTKVSDLTNDAGYLTEHQSLAGKQDKIDSSHKLDADLLSEGTTVKLLTASERSKIAEIDNKVEAQDITDTINEIFGSLSVTAWDDITLS